MDGRAWKAVVHGVAKSWTRLSDFTFTFHFHALEKAMATHSSVLAWRIPGTAEAGGLPSMGSHRVRNDWSDLAAAAVPSFKIPHVNGIIWYLPFSVWLTSLSMIVSGSIHVATNGIILFTFTANIPLYKYTTSSLSIYLLMDIFMASMSWYC